MQPCWPASLLSNSDKLIEPIRLQVAIDLAVFSAVESHATLHAWITTGGSSIGLPRSHHHRREPCSSSINEAFPPSFGQLKLKINKRHQQTASFGLFGWSPCVVIDQQLATSFRHAISVLWHNLVSITCKKQSQELGNMKIHVTTSTWLPTCWIKGKHQKAAARHSLLEFQLQRRSHQILPEMKWRQTLVQACLRPKAHVFRQRCFTFNHKTWEKRKKQQKPKRNLQVHLTSSKQGCLTPKA